MNNLRLGISRITTAATASNLSLTSRSAFASSRCKFNFSSSSSSSSSSQILSSSSAVNTKRPSSTGSSNTAIMNESSGEVAPPRRALEQSGLLDLCRHGSGDAVIALNVGGKDFFTLRSTVATNEVLAECVARAEANREFINGKAIFIDRDPTYFPLILNHLRNKVEGLQYYTGKRTSELMKHHMQNNKYSVNYHVQLPKDIAALRDIYIEACHYRIPELEYASCKQNFVTSVMGIIGGGSGSNPFDMANRLFQVLRRSAVALGGIGTIAITSQQDINLTKIGNVFFPAWFSEEVDEGKKSDATTPAAA